MPIYEYECAHCGSFEHSQSIHDRPLARCPKCRRKVQRLISASSFRLKGGGWYSDGYQKKGASGSGESDSKTTEAKATDSKPASGTASKKKPKAESTAKKVASASSSTSSD